MITLLSDHAQLTGPAGSLPVSLHDDITLKLAMLYEGRCEGLGPSKAAAKSPNLHVLILPGNMMTPPD